MESKLADGGISQVIWDLFYESAYSDLLTFAFYDIDLHFFRNPDNFFGITEEKSISSKSFFHPQDQLHEMVVPTNELTYLYWVYVPSTL